MRQLSFCFEYITFRHWHVHTEVARLEAITECAEPLKLFVVAGDWGLFGSEGHPNRTMRFVFSTSSRLIPRCPMLKPMCGWAHFLPSGGCGFVTSSWSACGLFSMSACGLFSLSACGLSCFRPPVDLCSLLVDFPSSTDCPITGPSLLR